MISEVFNLRDMPRIMAIVAGFFSSADSEKTYTIEIKEKKKKRSLDANSYYWVLVHKIADAANVSVRTVYREHIRDIGGNNDLVCVMNKAVDAFCKGWESKGLGWITEEMPSKLDGCTNIMVYYGSSTYDSRQMSKLIDCAITDCQEYGIEYLTPAEIARMIAAWGGDSDAES